ncbi:MAG: hypothetical protein ACRC6A_05660 [Fusobacteriaceae bacterium]
MKYCGNDEIKRLFDLAILESRRKEMIYYQSNGKYCEKVDTLDLLQMDLLTAEKYCVIKNVG